jgi:misacylated tRNA(Ala) deacylase
MSSNRASTGKVIASRLNVLVVEARPVKSRWITGDELAARPELVRTMSVKPPSGLARCG